MSVLHISTIRLVLLFKSIAKDFSPPPTARLKQNAVRLSYIDVILIDFGRIAARAWKLLIYRLNVLNGAHLFGSYGKSAPGVWS